MLRVPAELSRLKVRLDAWLTITSPAAKNFTQWPFDMTSAGSLGSELAVRTTAPEQLLNATMPVKSTALMLGPAALATAGAAASTPAAKAPVTSTLLSALTSGRT